MLRQIFGGDKIVAEEFIEVLVAYILMNIGFESI